MKTTVKISKQKDTFICQIYEDGVFTGRGGYFFNSQDARAFKEKIEKEPVKEEVQPVAAFSEDLEKTLSEAPDAHTDTDEIVVDDPEYEEDLEGQMSFV